MRASHRSFCKKNGQKNFLKEFLQVYLVSSYILLGHNAICICDWFHTIIYLHAFSHIHLLTC